MRIIQKKISDLIPYENNPRKNERAIDKVAASIKEFGFKVPIIIDQDNVIVAGHTRLKAAELLGLDKIPCIVADDLSDEQLKAFRLADNKTGEFAEWDFELLAEELQDITDIDMSEFGFEVEDIPEDTEVAEDFDDIDVEKLEKHYGVPYQGNKSRIADIIIKLLPEGKRLVDHFGGGVLSRIVRCSPASGRSFYTTI